MNRRKFLIGAGSLAAGSAAAMGTGAFSSVEADRTVSVNVADDSSALLSLDAINEDNVSSGDSFNENADYAIENGDGTIGIDITSREESGFDGSGVNPNAITRIFDIFTVTNQGTQPAAVWVPVESISTSSGEDVTDDSGFFIDPQATDKPNGSYGGTTYDGTQDANSEVSLTGLGGNKYIPSSNSVSDYISETDATWEDFTLGVGESFDFGVWIDTRDGSFDGDISMTIKAGAVDEIGDAPDLL